MQQQKPQHGAFIGGLVLGAVAGVILFYVVLAIGAFADVGAQPGQSLARLLLFVPSYVIGVGLGVLGFALTRKYYGILSGLAIGCAAGMLGFAALCNLIVGFQG